MPFFVYILFSRSLNKFYIGSTDDLKKRLLEHITGFYEKSYTSKRSDWELFFTIECASRKQAKLVETHIKNMKSRKFINDLKQYPELLTKIRDRYK